MARLKRYPHNRSNTELTDFDMGKIIPTMSRHCIQGTTVSGGIAAALQLAPMVHQALTQLRIDTFAIAAADRILWEGAEDFYTGGEDGTTRPVPPYIVAPEITGWLPGSIADHLGFPTGVPGLKCNALPFRLLVMWWNENIRDPQIQVELPVGTGSGEDTTTFTGDLRMNWPKDMFTTSRNSMTIGDDVVIPLATSAPVVGDGGTIAMNSYPSGTQDANLITLNQGGYASVGFHGDSGIPLGASISLTKDPEKSGMFADISRTTGILPEDFNFAMARAKWKSRRNLYGTRYKDWLAFLGIRYSDKRLQLPSTLSHGRDMIDISGVLQTAPGNSSYVGETAGRGSGFGKCSYKTYFEEPTTVVHLICVRPAPVYVNMMPPEWQFEVREDLYTPEFAHVGMVAEKKGTLFPTGTDADDEVFGYRNRYDEMRTGFNHVSGKFKTTNASYHQGRIFDTAPSLNSDFLECVPSPRIFADMENTPHIEAAAIRNRFYERNIVSPNGDPHFN